MYQEKADSKWRNVEQVLYIVGLYKDIVNKQDLRLANAACSLIYDPPKFQLS